MPGTVPTPQSRARIWVSAMTLFIPQANLRWDSPDEWEIGLATANPRLTTSTDFSRSIYYIPGKTGAIFLLIVSMLLQTF